MKCDLSHLIKLSVKSPSLSPPFPSLSGISKVRKFLSIVFIGFLCLPISLFDAQGSRVTIVIVQVRAVTIYVVAAVEALKEKERGYKTQFTTNQNWWKN